MPTYVFKGRNRMNEVVIGRTRRRQPRGAASDSASRASDAYFGQRKRPRDRNPEAVGRKKVKSKDLAIFTRQFSVMIDAGLPLVQCLDILSQQQQNKYFQQVLAQVRQDVEEGSTLAAAMARTPRSSIISTRTWSRPAKRAVFSI